MLAAKKIHSGPFVTMWRLIQVWSEVVAPFGIFMLAFSPPFVLISYAVCYAVPASCKHGMQAVVEKPVLLLSGMPPIVQGLRPLAGMGAGVLLIFMQDKTLKNTAGHAVLDALAMGDLQECARSVCHPGSLAVVQRLGHGQNPAGAGRLQLPGQRGLVLVLGREAARLRPPFSSG